MKINSILLTKALILKRKQLPSPMFTISNWILNGSLPIVVRRRRTMIHSIKQNFTIAHSPFSCLVEWNLNRKLGPHKLRRIIFPKTQLQPLMKDQQWSTEPAYRTRLVQDKMANVCLFITRCHSNETTVSRQPVADLLRNNNTSRDHANFFCSAISRHSNWFWPSKVSMNFDFYVFSLFMKWYLLQAGIQNQIDLNSPWWLTPKHSPAHCFVSWWEINVLFKFIYEINLDKES